MEYVTSCEEWFDYQRLPYTVFSVNCTTHFALPTCSISSQEHPEQKSLIKHRIYHVTFPAFRLPSPSSLRLIHSWPSTENHTRIFEPNRILRQQKRNIIALALASQLQYHKHLEKQTRLSEKLSRPILLSPNTFTQEIVLISLQLEPAGSALYPEMNPSRRQKREQADKVARTKKEHKMWTRSNQGLL